MVKSHNIAIADGITAHTVQLERLKSGIVAKAGQEFKRLERSLVADLSNLSPADVSSPKWKIKRLQTLLKQTRGTITTHYRRIRSEVRQAHREMVGIESGYMQKLINKPVGVELASVAVSPEQASAIVSKANIEGGLMKDWWKRQSTDIQNRFGDTIRQGILRGETTPEMVSRIRGTKKNMYKDGVMHTTKRSADRLVRTSTQKILNDARNQLFLNNQDVIKGVMQVSTLDLRTSAICRAYSGLKWFLPEYKPDGHTMNWRGGPPRHWYCRSTTIPVTKSWQELDAISTGGKPVKAEQFFRSRLRDRLVRRHAKEIKKGAERGGKPIKKWIDQRVDDAVYKAQASMDGAVPEDLNYEAWLKAQSESRQIQVMGPGKHKLWKENNISFTDLIDENGRPLTIPELKKKMGIGKPTPKPPKPDDNLIVRDVYDDDIEDLLDDFDDIDLGDIDLGDVVEPVAAPGRVPLLENELLEESLIAKSDLGKFEQQVLSRRLERRAEFPDKQTRYTISNFKKANKNLPDNITFEVMESQEDFHVIENWNKYVRDKPEDFARNLIKGIKTKNGAEIKFKIQLLQSVREKNNITLMVEGVENTSRGKSVFTATRKFHKTDDRLEMYHSYFEVDAAHRNSDIGKQFFNNLLEMYDRWDVKKITVGANIDVGGYAWARYGFLPDQDNWNLMRTQYREFMDMTEDMAAIRGPDNYAKWKFLHKMKGKPKSDLLKILGNSNPKSMWSLADWSYEIPGLKYKVGKSMLLGDTWHGTVTLGETESYMRMMRYIEKVR